MDAQASQLPQILANYPSRNAMMEAIDTLCWEEMIEKFGFSQQKLLTICKLYRLDRHLAKRPKHLMSPVGRKTLQDQAVRLGKNNSRVRDYRAARGWSAEVPSPTKEELEKYVKTHTLMQMTHIFQVSNSTISRLTRAYGLRAKPRDRRQPWPQEMKEQRREDHRLRGEKRGARIPTKAELEVDLVQLKWWQMAKKYGFCISFLKKTASNYGIAHLKLNSADSQRRGFDDRSPWPSNEEFKKMLESMSVKQVSMRVRHSMPRVRTRAKELGLTDLMIEQHMPSKESLVSQVRRSATLQELLDCFSLPEGPMRLHCEKIGVDLSLVGKVREEMPSV